MLDVGGKKNRFVGNFSYPFDQVHRLFYLNIDQSTQPDILANAECIPLADCSVDTIVCTQVLEHVVFPDRVLSESYRVLKRKGFLILSVPFMARIHADPFDYHRFTRHDIENTLKHMGFKIILMKEEGYFFTLLADMIFQLTGCTRPRMLRKTLLPVVRLFCDFIVHLDDLNPVKQSEFLTSFVNNYFVVAGKP